MHRTFESSYIWDIGIKQSGENSANPFPGVPDPPLQLSFRIQQQRGRLSGLGSNPGCTAYYWGTLYQYEHLWDSVQSSIQKGQ